MMQFNIWINEMWLRHCEEYLEWYKQMPAYDMQEYVNRYQEWLKEQYNKGVDKDD